MRPPRRGSRRQLIGERASRTPKGSSVPSCLDLVLPKYHVSVAMDAWPLSAAERYSPPLAFRAYCTIYKLLRFYYCTGEKPTDTAVYVVCSWLSQLVFDGGTSCLAFLLRPIFTPKETCSNGEPAILASIRTDSFTQYVLAVVSCGVTESKSSNECMHPCTRHQNGELLEPFTE